MNQDKYDCKFLEKSKSLFDIFHKKNVEYGAAYFKEENASQWFYEIKRKYIRLEQINKNNDKEVDAKKENLKDMAIYCIMELMRMDQ